MNPELIKKAREAKSAEELLTLAKENGMEITMEQAKEYFDRLHTDSELSDDELDSVAGGIFIVNATCPICQSDVGEDGKCPNGHTAFKKSSGNRRC